MQTHEKKPNRTRWHSPESCVAVLNASPNCAATARLAASPSSVPSFTPKPISGRHRRFSQWFPLLRRGDDSIWPAATAAVTLLKSGDGKPTDPHRMTRRPFPHPPSHIIARGRSVWRSHAGRARRECGEETNRNSKPTTTTARRRALRATTTATTTTTTLTRLADGLERVLRKDLLHVDRRALADLRARAICVVDEHVVPASDDDAPLHFWSP